MELVFNRTFNPTYGEAEPVTPGVRRITAPNQTPFTFRGTNTFLIGDESLAVLDPGPDYPSHIDAIVSAAGTVPITHILVSHTHRDHTPAAKALRARTGAPIYAAGAHRAARPQQPGETGLDLGADWEFQPQQHLTDGDIVACGRYRLECVATPGHTPNHLAFALVDHDVLFSGDHVMGWSTTVVAPPDGSMADYMASLDRLLDRRETLYLPAHGGEITDAQPYVRALKQHRLAREASILRQVESGDTTIEAVVDNIYVGLDPKLVGAARLSTLAHLEDLVARGLVESEGPPTLTGRYRRRTAKPDTPGPPG